jgi:hypothetical protein
MANQVVENRYISIIESVCYWLGYQTKIGREQLLHEASLRYPIADTLTANTTPINSIVLEKLHPIFKSKKIDLVIYDEVVEDPDLEETDNNLNEVFEFKLAKSTTANDNGTEHQRVFDDVVRLAYYNLWRSKTCYFLMAGTYENFKTFFVGQQNSVDQNDEGKNTVRQRNFTEDSELWNPQGIYSDWFEFDVGGITSKEFRNDLTFGLQPFQNNYSIREGLDYEFDNSIVVKTTCLAITPNGQESRTHAAGLWKIESEKAPNTVYSK